MPPKKPEKSGLEYIWRGKCLEDGCNRSFCYRTTLVHHLWYEHDKNIEVLDFDFESVTEFEAWKKRIEQQHCSNYILSSPEGTKKSFYDCDQDNQTNKSFVLKTKSEKVSTEIAEKTDSCEMPNKCISGIEVTQQKNRMRGVWTKTHYGHSEEVKKSSNQESDQTKIVETVAKAVPNNPIELPKYESTEKFPLTDIEAFNQRHGLKDGYVTAESYAGLSLESWVNRRVSEPQSSSSVLFYKKQGNRVNGFQCNDTCVIIMTGEQELVAKQFGDNVIAVDGVKNLCGSPVKFTTVMVLDENNETLPIAFMVCKRITPLIYVRFFQTIKAKIGSLKPKIFFTDLCEDYYKAWRTVMGDVNVVCYYPWQVEHEWDTRLKKLKKVITRERIKAMLNSLHEETEEAAFHNTLNDIVESLLRDEETMLFGAFFRDCYKNNCKKWARFYREACGIKANTDLNGMRQLLRYCSLDKISNGSLGEKLDRLVNYVKDRTEHPSKKTLIGDLNDINQGHADSLTLTFEVQTNIKGVKYTVIKNEKENYEVVKVLASPCCQRICAGCNICVHSYQCTCFNYFLNCGRNICKHIHFIVESCKNDTVEEELDSKEDITLISSEGEEVEEEDDEDIPSLFDEVSEKFKKVDWENQNEKVIKEVKEHLYKLNKVLTESACKPPPTPINLPILKASQDGCDNAQKRMVLVVKRLDRKELVALPILLSQPEACQGQPVTINSPEDDHNYFGKKMRLEDDQEKNMD